MSNRNFLITNQSVSHRPLRETMLEIENQRIGRIDRLGQRSKNLTVINFITRKSIETSIASGLNLKQNLFDGVLNGSNTLDVVDFSASGKAQFLQQLEGIMEGFTKLEPELKEMETTKEEFVSEDQLGDVLKEEVALEITEVPNNDVVSKTETMENVMNQGMQFLASLFKMSTGKDLRLQDQTIEIDKKTGEVIMRFKIPKM